MILLIVVGGGVWLALLGLAVVLCRAASRGDETDDRRAFRPVALAGERDRERADDKRRLAQLPRSNAR